MKSGINLIQSFNEFIDLFNLTIKEIKGITIVVSKTTEIFCENISKRFLFKYKDEGNIIIEAIKRKEIKVIPFECPQQVESDFRFSGANKIKFIQELNNVEYLDSTKFMNSVYYKIEQKLNQIELDWEKNPSIVFISKIKDEIESNLKNNPSIVFTSEMKNEIEIISDYIICIDVDLKVTKEVFSFSAPIIIVMLKGRKTIHIEIEGKGPTINFNEKVEKVINSKNLVISTKSSSTNILLADPVSKNFPSNPNFFRLESVLVNGNWTKYASHNNKFIDLIVYLNLEFGTLIVKSKFEIKTILIDLRLKLYINECTRTKKGIIEKFISIRACKDINEYLEKCYKTNLPNKVKNALLEYVIKLPSIFQLFMKEVDLEKFSKKGSHRDDLRKIKKILILNYIKLIEDFQNSKLQINNDGLHEAIGSFIDFCNKKISSSYGQISVNNSKFLEKLNTVLETKLADEEIRDFYNFFDTLSLSENKEILFNYQVTGDLSIYPNHQSLINKNIIVNLDSNVLGSDLVNLGNSILIGGGISIGLAAGRVLIIRSISSTGTTAATAATTTFGIAAAGIVAAVGVGLIGLDIGANFLLALAKSGYYDGEYLLDWEFYKKILS